jgi:hypothetical protein
MLDIQRSIVSIIPEYGSMTASPRLISLMVATNVTTIALVAFLLVGGLVRSSADPDEISVQRLNIVGPDGKTVIAISNKDRIAGPVAGGKAYPVGVSSGRENMAGMIFFNDAGDEMGGLVFNSWQRPDGKFAGIGHLSFDRFNDNQVVALEYKENAQTTQAGLAFYDRKADGSFKNSLDLIEEFSAASPERKTEIQKQLASMRERGDLGAERVFIGSKDREAQLVLKDSKGRARARLFIDASDEPRLDFLDADGDVRSSFPGPRSP